MAEPDLNDLLVLVSVVELGGFTAAANAANTPKSNISRKISRLETALGVSLLERSTRRMRLTEVGELYYQHALRIQEELSSAQLSLERLCAEPVGQLKVCTSVSVGQHLLAPKLAGFSERFAKVDIDLELSNRRVDLIEEGFDLSLRVGELEDSSLIARKLCDSPLGFYAAPEYLHRHSVGRLEQLTQVDTLAMSVRWNGQRWRLYTDAQRSRELWLDIQPRIKVNDFGTLAEVCCSGLGVAELPAYLGDPLVAEKKLERVLPDYIGDSVAIHLIYPQSRAKAPKLKALVDYLLTAQ